MVIVMSCVVARQCGCSVLTFICTRQVGAAIPATVSDAVFTSTYKSSNLRKETEREIKIIRNSKIEVDRLPWFLRHMVL